MSHVSSASELLTPHPLSTQKVCPPPAPKAGGVGGRYNTHSPGGDAGEGVGGQYFVRRQTLDWPLTVHIIPAGILVFSTLYRSLKHANSLKKRLEDMTLPVPFV